MRPLDIELGIGLVVVSCLLSHVIYDLIHGPLAEAWREQRKTKRARAERFEKFKAHLAGHPGLCPMCGQPLREHEAIENEMGIFAACQRSASYVKGSAAGPSARPVN